MSEPGMVIGGEFYPTPDSGRLGDAPLVRDVTGVEYEDWAARCEQMKETGTPDTLAALGMVAITVKRAHPDWSRQRIVQFVEDINPEGLEVVKGNEPEPVETGDDGPPAVAAEDSSTSSAASTTSAEPSAEGVPV